MPWRHNTYNLTEIRRGLTLHSISNRQRNLYVRSNRYAIPEPGDPRSWVNANRNINIGGGNIGWSTVTINKTPDRDLPFAGTINVNPGSTTNTGVLNDGNVNTGISTNRRPNAIPEQGQSVLISNTQEIFEVGYATWNNAWKIPSHSIAVLGSGVAIDVNINKYYTTPNPNSVVYIDYELREFVIKFVNRKPPPNETLTLVSGTKDNGRFVDSNGLFYEVRSIHLPPTTATENNPYSLRDNYKLEVTMLELYQKQVRFPPSTTQPTGINVVDGFMLDIEALPVRQARITNVNYPLRVWVIDGYDEDGNPYGHYQNQPANPAQLEIVINELNYNTVVVR